MPLPSGEQLGHYKIVSMIGKGGMGEVYLGTDTRLGRSVAIKVSAREFNDRFEREARAISALNHPNICTLHDVGPNYLVMEYIEGDTLSKLIEQGPLPLDKALAYAVQIVDALAGAHAKGIIHRDLKPGNIIITKNGVKVLDFGLAKLSSEKVSADSAVNIETVTEPITRAGAILGTLYYMAPEQVEGKESDERSDIFSFGVVFHEMITGQRPFNGDTQAAVLASLMKDQPPSMNQRQPACPRQLERIVRKCLEKKPDDRWQSARDLKPMLEMIDLDAPSMGSSTSSVSIPIQTRSRQRWLWPALGAFALLLAGGSFYLRPKAAPAAEAVRFEIGQPGNATLSNILAISPDGRRLAFVASTPGQPSAQLWVRTLETLESRPLEGTSGVIGVPFWSSDSKFLTFSAQGKLKKIDASGGPGQTLADVPAAVIGGFWTADNRIVFSVVQRGLFQVASLGGTPTPMNTGSIEELGPVTPSPLPNGRDFVYCQCSTGGGVFAVSLNGGGGGGQPKKLLPDTSAVVYAPSPDPKLGYLLFSRGASQLASGTLMAQPIDPSTLELAGDAFPLAEQVALTGFSASATGVLVYEAGGAALPFNNPGFVQGQMTWFDRQGKVISTVGEPGVYRIPKLSPDGSRVAIETLDVQSKNVDIWLFEFARGTNTRFTFSPDPDMKALWSRDGKHILYGTVTTPAVWYRKSADGTGDPELIFKPADVSLPASWSPDGRFVLYNGTTQPADIKGVDISTGSAADRKPFDVVTSEFNDIDPRFSPDGKWFAYSSNESGKSEIYVRPFNPPSSGTSASGGGKWMVSKGGGTGGAVWRGDGKELFFFSPDKTVMRVEVTTNPVFTAGVPEPLFKASQGVLYFDASPDGKRFLMPVAAGAGLTTPPYKVVLNWTSTVKK